MNIKVLFILQVPLRIYARVINKYLTMSMSSFEKSYILENS
jgi:hypothetical protein